MVVSLDCRIQTCVDQKRLIHLRIHGKALYKLLLNTQGRKRLYVSACNSLILGIMKLHHHLLSPVHQFRNIHLRDIRRYCKYRPPAISLSLRIQYNIDRVLRVSRLPVRRIDVPRGDAAFQGPVSSDPHSWQKPPSDLPTRSRVAAHALGDLQFDPAPTWGSSRVPTPVRYLCGICMVSSHPRTFMR